MKLPRIATLTLCNLLAAGLLLTQAGCLKTRTQIRGNGDAEEISTEGAPGAPAQPGQPAAPRNLRSEVDDIKNEVVRLNGKLEEVEHTQRNINVTDLRETVTRLDNRVTEMEKNQILIMTELKELKDKQASAAKEAAIPSSELLKAGKALLTEKKYDEAAEKFKSVLARGSKGKDAAEAYYNLGEADFAQKQFKRAIVNYSKVQESLAKSGRVPASLYKIGLSFQQLNMPEEAKGFFAELIERYPDSPEAKKAKGGNAKPKKKK